jgi:hypothetical protein
MIKKIIVTSDSHGNHLALKSIVEKNKNADLFIHLGDGICDAERLPDFTFTYVRGNCDGGSHTVETVIDIAGNKTVCTHGHVYGVKSGLGKLIQHAKSIECDIVLYGHTHIPNIEQHGSLHIMNPGSVYDNVSYGIITVSDNGEISMELLKGV